MPITSEEKVSLDTALAALDPLDYVGVARLLYATLLDAKISPQNPHGMGWKAISSLGQLTKNKSPWDGLREVEAAIEAPIRLPLIKSCDAIFRNGLIANLVKLDEEHKQTLAFILGRMDDVELVALTKVLYEIVSQTQFPDDNAQAAFAKFYWVGYTWDEMKNSPDILKAVLLPIVQSCNDHFASQFASLFAIEVPEQPSTEESNLITPTDPNLQTSDDMLAAELAKLEADLAEPSPESAETTGSPTLPLNHQLTGEDGEPIEDMQSEGMTPSDPMPIPEFGTPEEIAAREQADAEKPKFKDGKKKKKNRENQSEQNANGSTNGSANGTAHEPTSETENNETPAETKHDEEAPVQPQEEVTADPTASSGAIVQ
jgi:hypothetical protein